MKWVKELAVKRGVGVLIPIILQKSRKSRSCKSNQGKENPRKRKKKTLNSFPPGYAERFGKD